MDVQRLLASLLSNGGQQPPQNLPSIPVPQRNPRRQPPAGPASQLPSIPGIGNRVGDAFAGVANIRPGDSAMSAFAQGYSGARQAKQSRTEAEETKAARAAAAQADKNQQDFENQLALDEARRQKTRDRFDNLKTASDIEKSQRDNSTELTPKAYADLEKRMHEYREFLGGKYDRLLVEGDDPETIRKGIDELVATERQRQLAILTGSEGGSISAPSGPKGTEQNPYTPFSVAELDSVPTGAVFVNPADGQSYRKK